MFGQILSPVPAAFFDIIRVKYYVFCRGKPKILLKQRKENEFAGI